jgi:hypothetical protein
VRFISFYKIKNAMPDALTLTIFILKTNTESRQQMDPLNRQIEFKMSRLPDE